MRSYITPLTVMAVMLAATLTLIWFLALRFTGEIPFSFIVGIWSVPSFIVAALIIRVLPLDDEWKVGLQVAVVLTPLIILARTRDPYKEQIKVMTVPEGYRGKLEIQFVNLEGAYEKQPFDTVYFAFENGRLELAEDFTSIRRAMESNCIYYDRVDHKRIPVRYYEKGEAFPADTAALALVRDTIIFKDGKVHSAYYRIGSVGSLKK